MVIVEFVDFEKIDGQTNKHTNKQTNKKQTNQRRRIAYSRRATITNRMTDKPTKQKDYTSPALAGAGDYKKTIIASPSWGWRL